MLRPKIVRYDFTGSNEYTAEFDSFEDEIAGLKLVEVEFPAEQQAVCFKPPIWFGQEVTANRGYSNLLLASRGLPLLSPSIFEP